MVILEQANIAIKSLFLNADAGFDLKEFRDSCEKKKSMPMCASTDTMEILIEMNILIKDYIMKDMQSNEHTRGWTAIFHY